MGSKAALALMLLSALGKSMRAVLESLIALGHDTAVDPFGDYLRRSGVQAGCTLPDGRIWIWEDVSLYQGGWLVPPKGVAAVIKKLVQSRFSMCPSEILIRLKRRQR